MNEQARPRAVSLPPIIRHIAGAVILLTLAAWTGQGLLCYHRLWAWCGGEHYLTVAGLIALLVLAPIGWSYKERASRRASRGMWSRPGLSHQLTATFSQIAKFAVEGEWPGQPDEQAGLITGAQRFERRRWWIDVPLDGGGGIWIDRWELWRWLEEVEGLRSQLKPGESPIAERLWESRLAGQGGRRRWLAYVHVLECIGAADCPTGDPRSRRYIPGDPWSYVEEYERWRVRNRLGPSEVY